MMKINGYRQLTDVEVDVINSVKAIAASVGVFVDVLEKSKLADERWVAIGKTHLQEGFMALTRAIAKPEGF